MEIYSFVWGLTLSVGVYSLLRVAFVTYRTIVAKRHVPIVAEVDELAKQQTSIVVPVYHEDLKAFERALQSWIANKPGEIIIVIDSRDTSTLEICQRYNREYPFVQAVIEPKPGKRPALLRGFLQSTGAFVALVDSDVTWENNTLEHLLMPFKTNEKIGVVTGLQKAESNPAASLLYSYQNAKMEVQIFQYFNACRQFLPCVSGRTSLYKRDAIEGAMQALVEDFYGHKLNFGGDAAFLATYIQRNKWDAYFQETAVSSTVQPKKLKVFINQTLRWSRAATRQSLQVSRKSLKYFFKFVQMYAMGLIDIADACLLPLATLFLLSGFPREGILIVSCAFVGTLIPLFFFPTKLFLRHSIWIFLYEHIVGFARLYAVLTPGTQKWLTR